MAKKKTPAPKPAPQPITHVAIILDRSGSMESCRRETIAGFNEQVQKIKGQAKQVGTTESTFVSLVLFNHELEFVRFADPVKTLGKLTAKYYAPDGTTAMLDAVGTTLQRFEREIKDTPETSYLVIIITDGEENDSHEYTYMRVAEMIQKRQSTNRWTFSYMGANQDLSQVYEQLNIPMSNLASYTSDGHGTQVSFNKLGSAVAGFMDKRHRGVAKSGKFFREMEEIRSVEDEPSPPGPPSR